MGKFWSGSESVPVEGVSEEVGFLLNRKWFSFSRTENVERGKDNRLGRCL